MEMFQDSYTWFTLSFILFAYIVYRFGSPAIGSTLDQRIAQIKTDLETAESLRVEAQEMLAQYERKHRDSSKDAEKIIRDAKDAAKKIQANAEEELKESIARREKQLEERLERMQNSAMEEIRTYAASLSLEAAERMIIEKLDKAAKAKLAEQSIADISKNIH